MTAILSSLAVAVTLMAAFAAALRASQGQVNYPVLITGFALLRILLWLVSLARHRLPALADIPEPKDRPGTSANPLRHARLPGFAVLWGGYVLLLPIAGFLVDSIAALILSLWIANGRLSVRASLASAAFVVVLAILVSTILYIPVPKSGIDYWLDETIFTILGG